MQNTGYVDSTPDVNGFLKMLLAGVEIKDGVAHVRTVSCFPSARIGSTYSWFLR